jgi:hypothetical protein
VLFSGLTHAVAPLCPAERLLVERAELTLGQVGPTPRRHADIFQQALVKAAQLLAAGIAAPRTQPPTDRPMEAHGRHGRHVDPGCFLSAAIS